jgi:pyrroline-5-carboxylate reductase
MPPVTLGIVGLGNMGMAIAEGLAEAKACTLLGFDLDPAKTDKAAGIGMEIAGEAEIVAAKADYVLMALKPNIMEPVLAGIAHALDENTVIISIAAGITQKKLAVWSGGQSPVVRVMPNTPAMVGEGVFGICLEDDRLSEEAKQTVGALFEVIGQVHVLPEKSFDAFTAVAGCGPAYVFYFMEAIIEAGVTMGLTRPQVTDIVTALFSGSTKLAAESDLHVSQLREMVCSPGGSTIAGTNTLDLNAVRAAVVEAVQAAKRRNEELGA